MIIACGHATNPSDDITLAIFSACSVSQGDVLLKKAGDHTGRGDQFSHLDMGNHTSLVVPPDPESVAIIINYSESADTVGGPTCFLPDSLAQLAPGGSSAPGGMIPPHDVAHLFENDGTSTQLSAHELAVRYHPGVALVFRLDTYVSPAITDSDKYSMVIVDSVVRTALIDSFSIHAPWRQHHGSAVRPGRVRWTHHPYYRRAGCEWVGSMPWASALWGTAAASDGARRREVLEHLSPLQREALGFPTVGSAYWSADTLAAVQRWYPRMDLSCYAQGFGPGRAESKL